MLPGFQPGFWIVQDEDMGAVTRAARRAGVTGPLGAVVAPPVAAEGTGGRATGRTALLKQAEQLSGRNHRWS